MSKLPIYIFGEVLFDCFENTPPVLGGAPFNVAWHLQGFGEKARLISAVGNDEAGRRVQKAMHDWGLPQDLLQINPSYPTGTVNISITDNEPSYDIQDDCGYDYIHYKDEMRELPDNALIYHGSLALRKPVSEATLKAITNNPNRTLFIDINLRSPWWNFDKVIAAINRAEYVKLNIHELQQLAIPKISHSISSEGDEWIEIARQFKYEHEIVNLIVTLGELGAAIIDADGEFFSIEAPTLTESLVDSVGAGDAFASVTLLGILNDWSWKTTLERAQQFSGFIVTRHGALCANSSIYSDFSNFWNMN